MISSVPLTWSMCMCGGCGVKSMILLPSSCWRPCMGLDTGCVYRIVTRGEEGVVMRVISRVYRALSLVIIIVGMIALIMQKNDVRSYSVGATIIIVDLIL